MTTPSNLIEHLDEMGTIDDKNVSKVSADFDCPAAATTNDCVRSETSNDDYFSQSPLNLTRSQGLYNVLYLFISMMFRTQREISL